MQDPVEALILDLLEWIGPQQKPYSEVIEAWRTSCPRLPVWEEANSRGYLTTHHRQGEPAQVQVTTAGKMHLASRRPVPLAESFGAEAAQRGSVRDRDCPVPSGTLHQSRRSSTARAGSPFTKALDDACTTQR